MLILGFYLSIWGKSGDDINRDFLLHFKVSPDVETGDISQEKVINLIRKKMIPSLNSKFANSDIRLFFPKSNEEFQLLDSIPELIYAVVNAKKAR